MGFAVNLEFKLSQHLKDELLMCGILKYLDCGCIYKHSNSLNLKVRKFDGGGASPVGLKPTWVRVTQT